MRERVLDNIIEIIKDVLDNEKTIIQKETYLENIAEWDSVAQMTIMTVIEQQYNIRFEIDKIVKAKTVDDIVDMVMEKI